MPFFTLLKMFMQLLPTIATPKKPVPICSIREKMQQNAILIKY
jgi:hypothetical protein